MSLRPYRGGGHGHTHHNQQWRGRGGFSSSSDRPPPTTTCTPTYNNNHNHQPPSNYNYNYTYTYNSPPQPPPQQQHRVNNNHSFHNQPPPSYYNYSNPYHHHNHFPPAPLYNQSHTHQQQHYFPPPNQPPPPFYNYNNTQHSNVYRPQAKPLVVSDYRRKWEHAKPPPPHPPSHRFTVLSYNILADYLAINHRSQLYFHIPPYILDWRFRKTRILFELGLWSSDILCLQEVDRFHDLQQELKIRGYDGVWKMRTGEAVDGCAIFWRSTRFKLLHEEAIEFNKFGLRDNVAQICVLESLSDKTSAGSPTPDAGSVGSNKVVICNIHVLFNPKRGDIKLGQVRMLLEKAYATSKHWDDAPVVLCGDYNSTPKSSLYNFISEQKLNVSELPRDKISGQLSAEIGPRRPFTYNHRTPSNDIATQSPRRVDNKEGSSISLLTETTQIDTKEEREGNSVICTSEVVEKITSDVIISDNSSDTLLEAIEHVSVGEDSTSFLSELHGPGGTDVADGAVTVDGKSFVRNQNHFYDPSGWTPMEIETATGSSECMTMEHHLKLRSTYTEVQDYSGARDSYGEPQVTSYHRRFQGTVDYIWRSEGLQTVRVLAPIPKHAMQWTPGFPTKKWGSDHIALVAELAFTGHVDEEKSQVS